MLGNLLGICITPVDRMILSGFSLSKTVSYYVEKILVFLLYEMRIIVTLDLWLLSCMGLIEFSRKNKQYTK